MVLGYSFPQKNPLAEPTDCPSRSMVNRLVTDCTKFDGLLKFTILTPFPSTFYHIASGVNKQPGKVTKKGENIMAPLDVLKEIREETLDRVFEMSANRHMTLPKKGCEEDHARMTERADMLSILIDLLEH